MGLESINYHFKFSTKCSREDINAFLRREPYFFENKKGAIFLCGPDFWIDMLLFESSGQVSGLSIRIALCNPVDGVKIILKELLTNLFARFKGAELVDLNSKIHIFHFDDASWEPIWESYMAKYDLFVKQYGYLKLPVSSELFFKYIDNKLG